VPIDVDDLRVPNRNLRELLNFDVRRKTGRGNQEKLDWKKLFGRAEVLDFWYGIPSTS